MTPTAEPIPPARRLKQAAGLRGVEVVRQIRPR